MKKIAIVTATRAEYGLLLPIINELRTYENPKLRIELIVSGTHLAESYGMTIKEIERDGVRIDHRIEIPVESRTEFDISCNQAKTLIAFSKLFARECYDAIIILGDRYEILMVAIAAVNTHTPIFHINGGDTTEGAIDECIRHSVTKMSYLHFVTNEESRKRVIQLGEDPNRVFNYGSPSIDNIMNMALLTKKESLLSVNLSDCKYALCTYHPVTLENAEIEVMILNFINAISRFPKIEFIITKSNADQGGALINSILEREEKKVFNMHVFASLGVRRYLSFMKYAEFVIGNSSSGIMEAPSFHVPAINIGNRQRGRLQSESTVNCDTDTESIVNAIQKAMSKDMSEICRNVISPYGDGRAAENIAKKCIETIKGVIDLKKPFFDSHL